ncbi:MAG TPA: hypothetical protein ENN46_02670 [Candidatus Woesearchaeota archaeon]|nr:hypothetical protein [Candidatus Woesearchaeota archaeon]
MENKIERTLDEQYLIYSAPNDFLDGYFDYIELKKLPSIRGPYSRAEDKKMPYERFREKIFSPEDFSQGYKEITGSEPEDKDLLFDIIRFHSD